MNQPDPDLSRTAYGIMSAYQRGDREGSWELLKSLDCQQATYLVGWLAGFSLQLLHEGCAMAGQDPVEILKDRAMQEAVQE